MSDNQYVFEIIRDVGYLIQKIEAHETVWFHVTNDDGKFFTARSSKEMPCGFSETSRAIERAYKVTRDCPDSRDVEISQLQTEIESLRSERDRYKLRLSELCQLKTIKDKHGKTEEYNLRQPVAWKDAFTLLQEKKDEQYDKEAGKVRHHPKCDFLDIEGAKCDCGAYKDEH